jgi:hypothetical protein
MDEKSPPLIRNKILAALSDEEYQRLLPHLEVVDLTHGEVLYGMEVRVRFARFILPQHWSEINFQNLEKRRIVPRTVSQILAARLSACCTNASDLPGQ